MQNQRLYSDCRYPGSDRMVKRLRDKQKGRQKAALDNWEDEGGSVAKTDVAVP